MGYSHRVMTADSLAGAGGRPDGPPEPLPGQLALPGMEPEPADDSGQYLLPGMEDVSGQAGAGG